MSKKLLLPIILGLVLMLGVAGIAVAQTAIPPAQGNAQATPAPLKGLGPFGNFPWPVFDAAANALKLTPSQLFDQLHSGKTLAQVAQDQNVPLSTVQGAMQSAATTFRQNALSKWIDQAQQAGRLTADQANWLRQGLQNGWLNRPFLGRRLAGRPGLFRNFRGRPMQPAAPQAPSGTATPNFQ